MKTILRFSYLAIILGLTACQQAREKIPMSDKACQPDLTFTLVHQEKPGHGKHASEAHWTLEGKNKDGGWNQVLDRTNVVLQWISDSRSSSNFCIVVKDTKTANWTVCGTNQCFNPLSFPFDPDATAVNGLLDPSGKYYVVTLTLTNSDTNCPVAYRIAVPEYHPPPASRALPYYYYYMVDATLVWSQ